MSMLQKRIALKVDKKLLNASEIAYYPVMPGEGIPFQARKTVEGSDRFYALWMRQHLQGLIFLTKKVVMFRMTEAL